MEIPLRALARVRLHTFSYILKNWRKSFNHLEKGALLFLALLIVLASWRWVDAAGRPQSIIPANGGTFVEGVVGNSLDNIDLGRLTKAGLVQEDPTGQIVPDLATSWKVSDDKLAYNFVLNPVIASYEVVDTIMKNPTYVPGVTASAIDESNVVLRLPEPNVNFLNVLSRPLFPNGPYTFDRKKGDELRLKINKNYHLQRAYIDRVTIRLYDDQGALERAAKRGAINGALSLNAVPEKWQSKTLTLSKKHLLFVNSARTNLKSTRIREKLLDGQKPDGVDTLDVLEVNGESVDKEFGDLIEKLKASGVKVNERKVALKDAVKSDLPKRNYDLLYILVNDETTRDPYLLWNSTQRSGDGQNFAELANATIDNLTEQYRTEEDAAKKTAILAKINEQLQKEKVSIEYKSITETYAVSPKIQGFITSNACQCETDRFDHLASWYLNTKSIY